MSFFYAPQAKDSLPRQLSTPFQSALTKPPRTSEHLVSKAMFNQTYSSAPALILAAS